MVNVVERPFAALVAACRAECHFPLSVVATQAGEAGASVVQPSGIPCLAHDSPFKAAQIRVAVFGIPLSTMSWTSSFACALSSQAT